MNNYCRRFCFIFALLCFCCSGIVSPSNILVVSPVASTSHFKIGEAIAVGLADVGHSITIVSAYDYTPKNGSKIESIQITGAIERSEGKEIFKKWKYIVWNVKIKYQIVLLFVKLQSHAVEMKYYVELTLE